MAYQIDPKDLAEWCSIPAEELPDHPDKKVKLAIVQDSAEMGKAMAQAVIDGVLDAQQRGVKFRAIIPCGPNAWEAPFVSMVNEQEIDLSSLVVYHMDECLDWQGRELPRNHPYSFRGHMERHFYDPINTELRVPEDQRHWLSPDTYKDISEELLEDPADAAFGGWGQDGHLAYNQARREPFSALTLNELRHSIARIQNNNVDTIIAMAHRTFGGAYQFCPPMSATLGMAEILAAKKVRVYSDTGAWKQTALRVALFAEPNVDYPMTLLQEHEDALLTATVNTARHPVAENSDWELGLA